MLKVRESKLEKNHFFFQKKISNKAIFNIFVDQNSNILGKYY